MVHHEAAAEPEYASSEDCSPSFVEPSGAVALGSLALGISTPVRWKNREPPEE